MLRLGEFSRFNLMPNLKTAHLIRELLRGKAPR